VSNFFTFYLCHLLSIMGSFLRNLKAKDRETM
jgi:hypothetical protein